MGVGQFFTSRIDDAIGWARKFSIFTYPFVTACCGMEYMAAACSHYDIDRFGAELPRFSPRQADVLFVVGTINHKMAPVLKRIYDQMTEPKWVVAFGAVHLHRRRSTTTTRWSRASTRSSRWTSTSRAARRAPRPCWTAS